MRRIPNPIPRLMVSLGVVALASCSTAKSGTNSFAGSPTPSPSPSATASATPSPTVSPTASALVAPILADDVCSAIPAETIDSILGIQVADGASATASCSWQSQHPAGVVQLVRLTEAQLQPQLALIEKTEPKVSGVGIRAWGDSVGALPPPSPATGADLTVDFGTYAIYEHIGGPAVSVADAVEIAKLVSTPA